MHITKYKKDSTNKYKVYIDDEIYTLYDDIIIKYNLLSKKEIMEDELKEILNTNTEYTSYYDSIKYISRKIRSEYEINEYLKKKQVDKNIIDKTIKRLKTNNFINDNIFVKAFINDKINLSLNGPKKIKDELKKHNINNNIIDEYLNKITNDEWYNRVNRYIEKKKKMNHYSESLFKRHMISDLHNLGYSSEIINECVNQIEIDDKDSLIKDYNKIKNKLINKFEDKELEYKIKQKLYSKGYKISEIEGVINEN